MTAPEYDRHGIEVHEAGPEWISEVVGRGRQRRRIEQIAASLEEFERSYFGIEVGNERRYFESTLWPYIQPEKNLLDYGCGGSWWKDHWKLPAHVTGVEVILDSLEDLRRAFPDRVRYRLIYAPNGITRLPDGSFDQILSSSVIGYIHPRLATVHVEEIARLLKPSGTAIFTRVNAANAFALGRGRLSEANGGFAYRYWMRALLELIEGAGLEVIETRRLGLAMPIFRRQIQRLYGYDWFKRLDRLINTSSLFAVHHLVIAKKR